MPHRILTSAIAFVAIISAYGAYAIVVAPWIEDGPTAVVQPQLMASHERPAAQFSDTLQRLFREGSWERGKVNVLKTPQLLLIWKSHETIEDRRLKVSPLTIVFQNESGSSRSHDENATLQRTWLIRASAGAILQFQDELDISAGKFGQFHSGFIAGSVAVTGFVPDSSVDRQPIMVAADRQPVEILTKNLQFDDQRIWTSDEISFHWGASFGSGRDLTITLASSHGDARKPGDFSATSVQSVRLMRLERLHLAMKSRSDDVLGPVHSPLDVTAQGPLLIRLAQGVCQLTNRVQIERHGDKGQLERLLCDHAAIHFSRASGTGKPARQNALRIPKLQPSHVVATGQPAVVESLVKEQDRMTRRRMEATKFQYRFPSPQSPVQPPLTASVPRDRHLVPGSAIATGPGRVTVQRDEGQALAFDARFDESVQWLPHGTGGLLSMDRQISCTAAGLGTITAGGMELQLRNDPNSKQSWQPTLLRAGGNVRIAGGQLRAAAQQMHVEFLQPVRPSKSSANELALSDPQPATSPLLGLQNKDGLRIQMQGDRINLQVTGHAPDFALHSAALVGNVRCQEIPDAPGQRPRASLRGNEIRFLDLGRRQWRIDISGRPAVVQSEAADLTGSDIHIDAALNQAWMDGPGVASMPLPPQMRSSVPADFTRAELTWNGDMQFDGSQLVCRAGVSWRGPYQLLRGDLLRVRLAEPIQLQELQLHEGGFELATTSVEGTVFCENRMIEEHGLVAIDTAEMVALHYDHASGGIRGDGPGWIETVRRGSTPWIQSKLTSQPSSEQEFRFLRVDFERGMRGDLLKREVRFDDRVRTLYGPVRSWSDRLVATRREQLNADSLLLQCRELIVLQGQGSVAEERPLEMVALGETTIDGHEFSAAAERLSYDQAKDLLILEGNDRTLAQIWYRARDGEQRSKEVAKKLLFRPKTKELKMEGVQFLEFRTSGR